MKQRTGQKGQKIALPNKKSWNPLSGSYMVFKIIGKHAIIATQITTYPLHLKDNK
jgi:hypothetical protein